MSTRPLEFFQYFKNELHVEGVPVEKIAETVGTPVYIYSTQGFLKPLQSLKEGLKGLDYSIHFAMKSNSNLAILRLLSQHGVGMDLVSGGELFRAGKAGVSGTKIVFSGVGKTPGEMAQALQYDKGKGIYSFNVESTAELATLSAVAQSVGKTARVAFRFNPDVNPKTHPYISTGLKKNKFGLSRKEVLELLRDHGMYPGIEVVGLSIHIGSQLLSLKPLEESFRNLSELVDECEHHLARPLEFVDLGGGLGITYKNEKTPPLKQYCKLVRKYFGPESKRTHLPRILIEPGRLLSGNAGALISEVLYRKERKAKDFLIVDAAMNDLMRPALYGSHHEIVPVQREGGKKRKSDIVGPVCESSDCFGSDRLMPAHLGSGELLAVLSAGAYGMTMASNYNTRPRPAEVLVDGESFLVIRERESYEDLIRGERL